MGLRLGYTGGQTPLDEAEKDGLKISSITTQAELDAFEQMNIEKAVEWTIHARLRTERILTEPFVKDLHKRMYGEVWKWAGTFRKTEKNLGIPWVEISMALRNLLDDAHYWVNQNTYSPEETAVRFKHRLVSIHCFPNGNGRHSRMMADLIMEAVFKQAPLSWHASSKQAPDQVRKKYIQALHQADQGNLQPLIEFAVC